MVYSILKDYFTGWMPGKCEGGNGSAITTTPQTRRYDMSTPTTMTLEQAMARIATLEATMKARVKVRLTAAGDMVAIQLPTRRYEFTAYKDEIPLLFADETIAEVKACAEKIPDNLPKTNKSLATNGKVMFRR
jgi:hypothetical protein